MVGNIRTIVEMLVGCLTERALLCLGQSNVMGFDFGECESEFFYYDGDSTDASEYKMFLIYEEEDINNIIKILEWAKKGCLGDGPEQALKGENNDG